MATKEGDTVIYQTQAGDPSSHQVRGQFETYECATALVLAIDTQDKRQPATLKVTVDPDLAPVEFHHRGASFEIADILHGTAPGQWRTVGEARADWRAK